MSDVLLIFLLIFMVIPAFFSIVFASRSLFFTLWNTFWYVVMGTLACEVFSSERGYYLTLFFFGSYLFRAFHQSAANSTNTIFRYYNTQNEYQTMRASTKVATPAAKLNSRENPTNPSSKSVTVEVEFHEI